jgi:nucleoside-diphosphate-sugar epimerase
MKIALTGATGFLGRYIARALLERGDELRCWYRPGSDRSGFEGLESKIEWVPGELGDDACSRKLVADCDGVVHAALNRPGTGFRGAEGDLVEFVEKNVGGTLKLMEAARAAGASRFIFISTCAVHERILDDRPLDETHPLWPTSHYGAHKGAIEKFVHSFGLGMGYPICALRPTGIYGLAHPVRDSKWFDLVHNVVSGIPVSCHGGGKEVHAADVAKAVTLLLAAPAEKIAGEAFNCCDLYISELDVATFAKELTRSRALISGNQTTPRHQIDTGKLRRLGMEFGGRERLRETVQQLVNAANRE